VRKTTSSTYFFAVVDTGANGSIYARDVSTIVKAQHYQYVNGEHGPVGLRMGRPDTF